MDKWTLLVPEKKVIYWFDLIFQDNAYGEVIIQLTLVRYQSNTGTSTRTSIIWFTFNINWAHVRSLPRLSVFIHQALP